MSGKTRSIFEEVSGEKQDVAKPKGGLIDGGETGDRRAVSIWLMILFALVTLMIVVGGLTRLTDSGLSITEWKPVTGAIPPMSAEVWDQEFEKYKQIPEFELVNKDMTLAEFKVIYWWEWGHRQLGRVIGLVWFVGFIALFALKKIPKGWVPRLIGVGLLGGLQGAVGWWMVASGLTGRMVDVASYRLATHLGLAFIILGVLAWFIWLLRREEMSLFQSRRQRDAVMGRWANILVAVAFLQILLGALVAGIDAGRGYIDWPLMNGQVLPSESFDYTPFWSNFFENPALVQFNHRLLGYILFGLAIFVGTQARKSAHKDIRGAFGLIGLAMIVQMILGIVTVLNAAPWHIAILHQAGAIVLWVLLLRGCFTCLYPAKQELR